ncbi:Serine protease inhibitor 3/4 [Papilio machaon]|uniref:Serine protease inhibitor 3/4 n=1 Tax=Papilio machaon TaxID=76193 RepID=A0A194RC96_PAPMA|nr:Serine protease inhibitor 3/4 [Papilio machaon]
MVPMMYLEFHFKYGESQELGAQLLRMHYVGENASMLIVLPNEINGLDGVLKKLADGYDLMAEVDNMFNTKVQVTIPKFKIETEIDLCDLLPKLGIKAIFDSNNSGLTKVLNTDEKLYVSKAVQKAFIEVNEGGTEAAAATRSESPPPPLVPPGFIETHLLAPVLIKTGARGPGDGHRDYAMGRRITRHRITALQAECYRGRAPTSRPTAATLVGRATHHTQGSPSPFAALKRAATRFGFTLPRCCGPTTIKVRNKRSLSSPRVFRASHRALWCVLVADRITFMAAYRLLVPTQHTDL